MKNGHMIIAFDGIETFFDAGGNINFDRDQLLIRIHTPKGISGWHWDRCAALIQFSNFNGIVQKKRSPKCEVMLGLENSQEKEMTISDFQSIELKPANNLILIKGATQSAFINLDYFKWYRIYN